MDHGSVYRRCGCRDETTGRLVGAGCPGLGSPGQGSWYFSADLPSAAGERRRARRGGFSTRAVAAAALEALASPAAGAEPGLSTGEWLSRWLESRVSLRASTARSYAAHIRAYLAPYLGGIPLTALTAADVQAMFTAITRDKTALGRPVSAATLHRIHATLRAALNGAVRAGLIGVNPGRFPELPRAARPRAQVWTPALTGQWEEDGWRPAVGVWTAAQTAQFLRDVRGHRLYALFHLVALRGLRRGEAAGLRWGDLDLDAGTLAVTGQLQQLGGRIAEGPPKSDAGRRVIALDATTIAALREHRSRQRAERAAAGPRWAGTGYVFTTGTGRPFGPDRMTRVFRALAAGSGLPPVTLHGLRHGAATLALAAGADLKVVQDQLGHSTIALTAGTYTFVLPETARAVTRPKPRRCCSPAALYVPRTQGQRPGGNTCSRLQRGHDANSGHATQPDPGALQTALPAGRDIRRSASLATTNDVSPDHA